MFNFSVTITAGASGRCKTYHKTSFGVLSLSEFMKLLHPGFSTGSSPSALYLQHRNKAVSFSFVLFNDTWLIRTLRVIYDHAVFLCLQITRSDLRPHLNWIVNLVIADAHQRSSSGISMGLHGLTHPELSGCITTLSVCNGGCKLLCSNGHLDRSRWG